MTTFLKYVERYQDLTFTEKSPNEVDVLILNELVYFPLENFVVNALNLEDGLTLEELAFQFAPYADLFRATNWVLTTQDRIDLLYLIAKTPRYHDVKLFGFREQIDLEIELQFAAVSFLIPMGSHDKILAAFRGTDDSLIGWKEDANMSFQVEVPSQHVAKLYLNHLATLTEQNLLVSGHSKGGNLAIYASSFVPLSVQERIDAIYSFDGPGMHLDTLETSDYENIQNRINFYVPEDSIVGMMLEHTVKPTVIKSRKLGFAQHLVTNWLIEDDHLMRSGDVSASSLLVRQILREWTAQYTVAELEFFVNQGFDLLFQTGAKSLVEITNHKLKFIKLFTDKMSQIDPSARQTIDEQFADLFRIAFNLMRSNQRQQHEDNLLLITSWLKQLSTSETFKLNLPSLRQLVHTKAAKEEERLVEDNDIQQEVEDF